MQIQVRRPLFVTRLISAVAGILTLAAGIIWLRNHPLLLFPVALLIMGVFQLLLAFVTPGHKVSSTDSEIDPFFAWVLLIAALLALLAGIGFIFSALLALA